MHAEHAGLVAAGLRVRRRPAQHLAPVRGQALDVLRVLVVVGERMVELRIRETARVMGLREREQRSLPTGELEQRRAHGESLAHGTGLKDANLVRLRRTRFDVGTGRNSRIWFGCAESDSVAA